MKSKKARIRRESVEKMKHKTSVLQYNQAEVCTTMLWWQKYDLLVYIDTVIIEHKILQSHYTGIILLYVEAEILYLKLFSLH